jgi:hypothetical protein
MNNDMLNSRSSEFRKIPYSVPEGYFDTLKNNLRRESITAAGKRSFLNRAGAYASIAAAFLILITAGTILMKSTIGAEDMTYEDYLVYSGSMTNEDFQNDIDIIENEINEEDIIEYLIYTGVTAELIEISK